MNRMEFQLKTNKVNTKFTLFSIYITYVVYISSVYNNYIYLTVELRRVTSPDLGTSVEQKRKGECEG